MEDITLVLKTYSDTHLCGAAGLILTNAKDVLFPVTVSHYR